MNTEKSFLILNVWLCLPPTPPWSSSPPLLLPPCVSWTRPSRTGPPEPAGGGAGTGAEPGPSCTESGLCSHDEPTWRRAPKTLLKSKHYINIPVLRTVQILFSSSFLFLLLRLVNNALLQYCPLLVRTVNWMMQSFISLYHSFFYHIKAWELWDFKVRCDNSVWSNLIFTSVKL